MLLFQRNIFLNKILFVCLIVWMTFLIPNNTWAQVQRMGVAKWSGSLVPGGVSQVKSYCMDHQRRPAPSSKDTYSRLLSGDGQVIFEGKTMSLQKAMDGKLLAIRGVDSSVEETFQSLEKELWKDPKFKKLPPQKQQEQLDELKLVRLIVELGRRDNSIGKIFQSLEKELSKDPKFKNLPPKEQLEVLNFFRYLKSLVVESRGTHKYLSVVNLTDKPMEINFTDNVVFGNNQDTIGNLNPSLIKFAEDAKEQESIQEDIWRSQDQHDLIDLGYLPKDFTSDGKLTEPFKDGLKNFQIQHGLQLTEQVHFLTTDALLRKALLQNRAKQENENGNKVVLIVEMLDKHDANGEAQYAIYGANPPPKITSSPATIAKLGQNKGNKQLRLEFDESSINVDQRELLATNFRLNQLAQKIDFGLSVKGLTYDRKTNNVRITGTIRQYDPIAIKYDDKTEQYSATITDLSMPTRSFVMTITAKSKEAVIRIIQEIMMVFSKMPDVWSLPASDFERRVHEEISKISMPTNSKAEVEITIDDQVKKIKISEQFRVKPFNLAKAM